MELLIALELLCFVVLMWIWNTCTLNTFPTTRLRIHTAVACLNESFVAQNLKINGDVKTDVELWFQWVYISSDELLDLNRALSDPQLQEHRYCWIFTQFPPDTIGPVFRNLHLSVIAMHYRDTDAQPDTCVTRQSCSITYVNCTVLTYFPSQQTESAVVNVLINLILHLKWTNVILIIEDTAVTDEVSLNLSTLFVRLLLLNLDKLHETLDSAAGTMSRHDSVNIAIICKNCQSVLNALHAYAAKDRFVKGFDIFAEIVLISQMTNDPLSSFSTVDNILMVSMNGHQYLGYDDMQCIITRVTEDVCYMNDTANRNVNEATHCIITNIEKYYRSDNCIWHPVRSLVWKNRTRVFETVGFVNTNGDIIQNTLFLQNKLLGFNGRKLRVTTMEDPLFVTKTKDVSFHGICIDILKELSRELNFTYDISFPPDMQWGYKINGSWNGIIGQLSRQEADLAVSSLGVIHTREVVMDYTYPFNYERMVLVMRSVDAGGKAWMTLLRPLSWTLMMFIAMSLVIASVILYLLERVNPYYKYSGIARSERFITYQHALWYLYGALLTQGGERLPFSLAGRTFLSSWWLFSLVIVATYTGNLIAFLTMPKTSLPFEDITGLVQQTEYTCDVVLGSYSEFLIMTSNIADFVELRRGILKIPPAERSNDIETHVQLLHDRKYVFIGDETRVRTAVDRYCSQDITVKEILTYRHAFGLPNNSVFTSLFSNKIIEMHESGQIQRWKHKRWPKKNQSCSGTEMTARVIGLDTIQSAFYLCAAGVFLSASVLMSEIILSRCSKRYRNAVKQR